MKNIMLLMCLFVFAGCDLFFEAEGCCTAYDTDAYIFSDTAAFCQELTTEEECTTIIAGVATQHWYDGEDCVEAQVSGDFTCVLILPEIDYDE